MLLLSENIHMYATTWQRNMLVDPAGRICVSSRNNCTAVKKCPTNDCYHIACMCRHRPAHVRAFACVHVCFFFMY